MPQTPGKKRDYAHDPYSRNDESWNFVLIIMGIIFVFIICVSYTVSADAPVIPHTFYGEVCVNDNPAGAGTYIEAIVAGGGGNITTVDVGYYGSLDFLGENLTVQGGISDGSPVTFFVDGIAAECYDVSGGATWEDSFPFTSGQSTNLDLRTYEPRYEIEVSTGTAGSVHPNGTVEVLGGNNVTFDIIPDNCYTILDVIVDNESCGRIAKYTFELVDDDHSIQAVFEPAEFTIYQTTGPGGSIDPDGNLTFSCGKNATYHICPDEGWQIIDLFVDEVPAGPIDEYTFGLIDSDHLIHADFGRSNYTIFASSGFHGNISPDGNISVNYGDDKTFRFHPDEGFWVAEVLVDGESQGSIPEYTFSDIADDHLISATFEEGAPEALTTTLTTGWNLFSTPVCLETGHTHFEDILPGPELEKADVILGWGQQGWFIPGPSHEMHPLDCVYVHVTSPATAYIYPSPGASSPSSRTLGTGINLVGTAPAYQEGTFPAMPVEQAFRSIEYAPSNLTGYTMVISPSTNQPGWIFVPGQAVRDILPFRGYWIVMENPDTLFGFSTTPIS